MVVPLIFPKGKKNDEEKQEHVVADWLIIFFQVSKNFVEPFSLWRFGGFCSKCVDSTVFNEWPTFLFKELDYVDRRRIKTFNQTHQNVLSGQDGMPSDKLGQLKSNTVNQIRKSIESFYLVDFVRLPRVLYLSCLIWNRDNVFYFQFTWQERMTNNANVTINLIELKLSWLRLENLFFSQIHRL